MNVCDRTCGPSRTQIVDALGPLDETVVDKDLWAMIGGVGAPWTVEDLHATGRLHRISAAG